MSRAPRISLIADGWDFWAYLVRDVETVEQAMAAITERYADRFDLYEDPRALPKPDGTWRATLGFWRWEIRGDMVEMQGERGRLSIAEGEAGAPGSFEAIQVEVPWL